MGTSNRNVDDDRRLLRHAVELATTNVAEGGGPFGAVIVRDGEVLAAGGNRVTRDNDPTAHAEVVAIRKACAALGTFALDGCTLYASCEPCPLCLAACLWARLDRVVFAADRNDAAAAGFDDSVFYDRFAQGADTWEHPRVETCRVAESGAPFAAWRSRTQRTEY